jgi:ribosomal protein S18 acetylase RimI-like enzyme
VDRFSFEPLGPEHDRAAFSCGVEPLDRYLRQQATQDAKRNVAAPFILRRGDSPRVLGYYTLAAYGIRTQELPPEVARRLPRYEQQPAILIGRLARDVSFPGQRLGELLLLDALRRSLAQSDQLGVMAVVVDAKDDAARSFYEKYGFQQFPDHEYKLYLPIGTIRQLLGDA